MDILRRKFPVLAPINLTLDGIELTGKATKAWRAIVKMEEFGSEVIEKLLFVISNRAGGVLGKLKWKNNSVGAELSDIDSVNQFWEEFKALFPDITGPYANPSQPLEEVYKILGDSIQIKYYPVSGTTGDPTLSIKKGNYIFKIRFL